MRTYGNEREVTAALTSGTSESLSVRVDASASWGHPSTFTSLGATTAGVVLVDRSHWGRLRVSGADRLKFLHGQSTAHFLGLQPGQGVDTVYSFHKIEHIGAVGHSGGPQPQERGELSVERFADSQCNLWLLYRSPRPGWSAQPHMDGCCCSWACAGCAGFCNCPGAHPGPGDLPGPGLWGAGDRVGEHAARVARAPGQIHSIWG